jgi:hypothetical protein
MSRAYPADLPKTRDQWFDGKKIVVSFVNGGIAGIGAAVSQYASAALNDTYALAHFDIVARVHLSGPTPAGGA